MIVKNDGHPTKSPSTRNRNTKTEDGRERDAGPSKINKDGVQGEGDYKAAREFNESERKFVASGKVAAAARAAAPRSEAERQEMIAAEYEGKRRAKESDPALTKARSDSATPKVAGKNADRKRG
jgi:hypothetical protein